MDHPLLVPVKTGLNRTSGYLRSRFVSCLRRIADLKTKTGFDSTLTSRVGARGLFRQSQSTKRTSIGIRSQPIYARVGSTDSEVFSLTNIEDEPRQFVRIVTDQAIFLEHVAAY